MLNLEHIKTASTEVKKKSGYKSSKVLQDLITIVQEANNQGKPVTIKLALMCLGKDNTAYGAYIRTVVTKNKDKVYFEKVNGLNVIKLK